MSYVTNTERSQSRYSYYGYPVVCGASSTPHKTPVDVLDEHVTSWRGKIEYLQFGRRKRRVFRHFQVTRYQLICSPTMTFRWCPGPGYVIYAKDAYPVAIAKNQWLKFYNGTSEASWTGSTFPIYGFSEFFEHGEVNRAEIIRDLFVKLNEPRWSGAKFFAELGETLTSIKDLFWNCIKIGARAGRIWKSVKHLTLNSEELWLWYRYFLIPAMLDAEDLLKAIKPQDVIDRVQTGRPRKTTATSGTILMHGWFAPGYTLEVPWVQTLTEGYGGAIDVQKRFDPNPWGFGAKDIQAAIWEVIPFSFVVDWFLGVGDFLTTLRDVTFDYCQSYATYAIESRLELKSGTNVLQSENPVIRQTHINRIIDLEPPTLPIVNRERLNVLRTIDSISLAATILKSMASGKRR